MINGFCWGRREGGEKMIQPIENNLELLNYNSSVKSFSDKENKSFSKLLKNNINKVNRMVKDADEMSGKFAAGEVDNIHDVTIAAEKAKTAVKFTSVIQSQVIDAYNEVMRIQV